MVTIRRATEEDLLAVSRIHRETIRVNCPGHYTQEQIEAWAGRPWNREKYLNEIGNSEYLVAEEDGVVLGFGILGAESRQIRAVYVGSAKVRHGIGSRILKALHAKAEALGIASLWLHASLNSVPFYCKAGYRIVEKTTHRFETGEGIPCIYMVRDT